VERHRAPGTLAPQVAAAFADWGIPTVDSLLAVRPLMGEQTLIASGGIRTGVEAAKALALGADAVALTLPFLKAALLSPQAVAEMGEALIEQLKTAMFCIGAGNLWELKDTPFLEPTTGPVENHRPDPFHRSGPCQRWTRHMS
jgi:isopentenyl-diphosphate delta-isomerase